MAENNNPETTETNVEELKAKLAEAEKQVKNLKTTLSERNSEAAQRKREAEEWKNKFNATLSEQEQAEAKRKEDEQKMADRLHELERTNAIATHKAKYLGMGYSEELAQSSAVAMVDGNSDVLYQNMNAFINTTKETVKAEMLKEQPSVSSGATPTEIEKQKDALLRKYAGL